MNGEALEGLQTASSLAAGSGRPTMCVFQNDFGFLQMALFCFIDSLPTLATSFYLCRRNFTCSGQKKFLILLCIHRSCSNKSKIVINNLKHLKLCSIIKHFKCIEKSIHFKFKMKRNPMAHQ